MTAHTKNILHVQNTAAKSVINLNRQKKPEKCSSTPLRAELEALEPALVRPLSKRIENLSSSKTSKMRVMANELKYKGHDVINFASGELAGDTSDVIKHAARKAIDSCTNKYTPTLGTQQLREQIASKVTSEYGVAYQAMEVAITAGAKQALYNAVMVLLNDGDEVLVPQPYWVTFPTQISLAGGKPVYIDTKDNDYRLTAKSIESKLTSKSKAIVINTPNNPTGVVIDKQELIAIAELAYEHNLWVIFDECYSTLVRPQYQHHNIVQVFSKIRNQTLIVNSFSKSMAITGWRIGYVCGPKHVISGMGKLQGHTTSNPSSIAQAAICEALQLDDNSFIVDVNAQLHERANIALELIRTIDGVHCTKPEGAFYLYLDISKHLGKTYNHVRLNDVDKLCELLLSEEKIAVVSGSAFGDSSSIRLSYAIGTSDVVDGLGRLRQFLAKLN